MKLCRGCGIEKEESLFNKNKAKKDGLQTQCRECNNLQSKKHYRQNKDSYILKARKHNSELKRIIREMKSCTPCADCKKEYPYFCMDFDHLDDKKFNISRFVGTSQGGLTALREEIKKCEIVCANCHRLRTAKRQGLLV